MKRLTKLIREEKKLFKNFGLTPKPRASTKNGLTDYAQWTAEGFDRANKRKYYTGESRYSKFV